jgi:hypothetical protein
MTPVPWVHLLFPERFVMQERRRYDPRDAATRYAEVSGGLNQMTLRRFLRLMRNSDLECVYLRTNMSRRALIEPIRS